MARRQLGPGGLVALTRWPGDDERARVRRQVVALLGWQRSLRGWPAPRAGLDATPFVSLYAGGRLRGCFGSVEGDPAERLARAFLRAVEDVRYGGVDAGARAGLVAQIAYPWRVREAAEGVAAEPPPAFELGVHGVVVALPDGRSSVVLPLVAREARLDARGMIEVALRKAGAASGDAGGARLWLFETCEIAAGRRGNGREGDSVAAAEAWLASLVDADGAVAFGVDPRTGARQRVGEAMHHGRAAVVVAALARRGRHRALVTRARARLAADARAALAGKAVPGWPADPAVVAGTLALARIAGAPVEAELAGFARAQQEAIAAKPWHAGQVALALGVRAEDALLAACARDLARAPWAPWTAMAARATRRAELLARAEAALVASIRAAPPHLGGVGVTSVPELALTAVAVEALAPSTSAAARRAVARARAFLRRWQLVGDRLGAAYDVAAARGAFPISPVFDALRCDVTAHAVLALVDGAEAGGSPILKR